MASCNSPCVSFTSHMRCRALSANSKPDTRSASFRLGFVLYEEGRMSSCEGTLSKTPIGSSQSDTGGGGVGA
eukprot:867646-Prorocentrum_lima.AAC.1